MGPEARIRNRYRLAALKLGYVVLVLHGSAYSGPGRADTLTIAKGRLIAIEFKTEVGRATNMQLDFLRAVRAAGGGAFIARRASDALDAVALIMRGVTPYRENDMELDFSALDEIEIPAPLNSEDAVTNGAGDALDAALTAPAPETAAPPARQPRTRRRTPKVAEVPAPGDPASFDPPVENGHDDGSWRVVPEGRSDHDGSWDDLTQALRALTWEITALREEIANQRYQRALLGAN